MSVMKNSLPTSINIVATAIGSLFALPKKSPSTSMHKKPAAAKQTRRKTPSTWRKIRRQPKSPSLIFKRKLASHPRSFDTQDLADQFAADFQAGKISEAELSLPDEFFAVRHPARSLVHYSISEPFQRRLK